ncbi:MAG TPA: hypothetical protein VKB86_19965 [Pyrinomonadaceae bacterium]|nr:hypothetical protein [Pyrinomonadaceae bacterium]
MSLARRIELREKLRQITDWQDLDFDENGALRLGVEKPEGGSETARELLTEAASGENVIVLEDASNRLDVVFCRVVEGRWKTGAGAKPHAFVVMIDFADFSHVMGDGAALAAFNVGWGVLHEIEHVVHDSVDPVASHSLGECESLINQMRRECGLAERAEYHFTLFPGTSDGDFKTTFVRLAFDSIRPGANKKERHWLIWDAKLVGGLDEQKSLLARM